MQYNQQRVLDRLIEMIKINSVSYHEGPMTDYLQKYFEDLGYEVYRDNAGEKIGGDHAGTSLFISAATSQAKASFSTLIRTQLSLASTSSLFLKTASSRVRATQSLQPTTRAVSQ